MNDIFFVTSAIGNNYGVYSISERFQQLMDTINSIKKYAPNSKIVLFDASEEKIPGPFYVPLKAKVDHFVLFAGHPYVEQCKEQQLSTDVNLFQKKTVGELIMMINFLNYLIDSLTEEKFRRVFKISGRYKLNDNFLLTDYDQYNNKVVMGKKNIWNEQNTYYTRLWSFDYNLSDQVRKMFFEIHESTIQEMVTANMSILEGNLYKFLHSYKFDVVELDVLGVEGNYGQDGAEVNE